MTEQNHAAAGGLRDRLTGLPGVAAVRVRLAEWRVEAACAGNPDHVHALLVGLQRFDAVNIAYGEATGDSALAEVATRVQHWASLELE
jgi:GGDEF domain-containing protein